MNTNRPLTLTASILVTLALIPGTLLAKPEPEACIELGALAYDDWTSTDGGGSGLPAGESNVEYLRCVSCHGWDRLGEFGGFVRRERTADHPNAGLGDTNTASRFIAPGLGSYYHVGEWGVLHEGRGRSYEDGSGSWVELDSNPTTEELAAHAAGYTLGNLHPDFSTTGVNGGDVVLTQDQVDCLVDFINYGDSDPKYYFLEVDQYQDPVRYVINSGASATAGRTFYEDRCLGCHGEHNQNLNGALPNGGMAAYMQQDGAYSEFVHHARWGIPDSIMTRDALGKPTSQNMIDVMLYLQEYVAENTTMAVTKGFSGTWYLEERDGEGFVIDVAPYGDDGWQMIASYYTYDGVGNQVWLIGAALVDSETVTIPMEITEGGTFGELFDPTTIVRADWGTLEFTFSSCWNGHVTVTPNAEMLNSGMGFEAFEFDIERSTPPGECP